MSKERHLDVITSLRVLVLQCAGISLGDHALCDLPGWRVSIPYTPTKGRRGIYIPLQLRLSVLSTRSIDVQRNQIRCQDIALSALETATLAPERITLESVVIHSNANLWHAVTHTFKPDWQMKEAELISRRGISQHHSSVTYLHAITTGEEKNSHPFAISFDLQKQATTSTTLKETEVTPSASTHHPHRSSKSKANPPSFPEKKATQLPSPLQITWFSSVCRNMYNWRLLRSYVGNRDTAT